MNGNCTSCNGSGVHEHMGTDNADVYEVECESCNGSANPTVTITIDREVAERRANGYTHTPVVLPDDDLVCDDSEAINAACREALTNPRANSVVDDGLAGRLRGMTEIAIEVRGPFGLPYCANLVPWLEGLAAYSQETRDLMAAGYREQAGEALDFANLTNPPTETPLLSIEGAALDAKLVELHDVAESIQILAEGIVDSTALSQTPEAEGSTEDQPEKSVDCSRGGDLLTHLRLAHRAATNPSEPPSNLDQESEVQEGLGLTADYVDRQFFKAYQTVATMDGATFKGEKWLNRDEVLDYLDGLFPFGKESSPPTPEEGVRLKGDYTRGLCTRGETNLTIIARDTAEVELNERAFNDFRLGPVEIIVRPLSEGGESNG